MWQTIYKLKWKNILPSIQPVNSDGYQSYCKLWTNNFLNDG